MMGLSQLPLDPEATFEIRTPSGGVYRIYADGRATGFEEGAVIVNRIPLLRYRAARAALDAVDSKPHQR